MIDLKIYNDKQIVKMIEEGKVTRKDFLDSGVCPTCFDRRNKGVLYGDDSSRMYYEDDEFECFLVADPRAKGHSAISTKKHYRNMMELDDGVCSRAFVLAKKAMNAIHDVYGPACVYECTMCDGEMNHFHLQLIPRYGEEERGSQNFVKPRMPYEEEKEKIKSLRERMKK